MLSCFIVESATALLIALFEFQLPPPTNNITQIKVSNSFVIFHSILTSHKKSPTEFVSFQTETALMYDAVHLFAKALHDLDSSQRIDINPLSCDAVDTWPHGYSLINYMKIVSHSPASRMPISLQDLRRLR